MSPGVPRTEDSRPQRRYRLDKLSRRSAMLALRTMFDAATSVPVP